MQGFVGGHGEQTFSIEQAWTARKSSVRVTCGRVPEIKAAWLDVTPSVNKPCWNRTCLLKSICDWFVNVSLGKLAKQLREFQCKLGASGLGEGSGGGLIRSKVSAPYSVGQ